jgi:LPXTG-motif cell wall-anchored protein
VQDFAYAQANHTSLLLLGLSFLALLIIYGRGRRAGV